MSCEALWSLEYVRIEVSGKPVEAGRGGGVVVFETSKLYGGDISFYYIGEYKIKDGVFKVDAKVKRYNDYLPALYEDEYSITFTGDYDESGFIMSGKPDGDDDTVIAVKLTKLVDLD